MPEIQPSYRNSTAAEDAAHLEDLKNGVPRAQNEFDEALANYREAVKREVATKGADLKTASDAQAEAARAEQNLSNARWDLIKAK